MSPSPSIRGRSSSCALGCDFREPPVGIGYHDRTLREVLSISVVLWTLALAVGAADGFYFHLWKYRLYSLPRSRKEHIAHTGRAVLLPPTLWLAFGDIPGQGLRSRIYMLGSLVMLDALIGIGDALIEHGSRRDLGGLPRYEYLIHVVATGLHSGAEALAIVAWLAIDLRWAGDRVTPVGLSPVFHSISSFLLVVAAVVASAHVALLHPGFARRFGSLAERGTRAQPS